MKVPHMGWNTVCGTGNSLFFTGPEEHFYFVHSFYGADCEKSVIALTDYGAPITAAVASGNVYGCQFHPEKSGQVGLNILRAFVEIEGQK